MSLPPEWEIRRYIRVANGKYSAIKALVHWAAEPDSGDARLVMFLDGNDVPAHTMARALRGGHWNGNGYAELEQALNERPALFVNAVDSRRHRRKK